VEGNSDGDGDGKGDGGGKGGSKSDSNGDDDGESSSFKDVAMVNFRGNIIVDSGEPYEEDSWGEMWITNMSGDWQRGDVVQESSLPPSSYIHMRRLAPCQRCTITAVDPETGKFRDDQEPLKTLMDYRRKEGWGSAPVLGSYVGVDVEGAVKIGDAFSSSRSNCPNPIPNASRLLKSFGEEKYKSGAAHISKKMF